MADHVETTSAQENPSALTGRHEQTGQKFSPFAAPAPSTAVEPPRAPCAVPIQIPILNGEYERLKEAAETDTSSL